MKKELSSSKGDNLVIWRVFVGDTLELLTFGVYLQIQICQLQVSHQEGKDCGEDTSRTSTSLLSLITAFIILTYISSSFSDQQALNLYVEPSRCSKAFQMNEGKLLQISYCLQREVTMPQRCTKKLGLYLFYYVQLSTVPGKHNWSLRYQQGPNDNLLISPLASSSTNCFWLWMAFAS